MYQKQQVCSHCQDTAKVRRRDFSEQAWTVLVLWGEVEKVAVDQPLCDSCYDELREVLIDRQEEIEVAVTQPKETTVEKPAAKKKKTAKMAG